MMLILSEIDAKLYANDSHSPKGTGYELNHIVDVFKLLSHVVRELDFELVFHKNCQLNIVQIVET